MSKQEPITVPAERQPSLWNRYALTGLKIGVLPVLAAMAFGGLVLGGGSLIFTMLATTSVAGAAVAGAFYGKEKAEKELLTGHPVNPPTLLNEGALNGLLNGLILGGLAMIAAPALISASWLMPALAGATATGALGLGYVQGRQMADQMAVHYAQAQSLKDMEPAKETGGLLDKLRSVMPNMPEISHNTVTPNEAAELDKKTRSGGKGHSAVQALLQERASAEMASHEPSR